jgi:hypothetical protein
MSMAHVIPSGGVRGLGQEGRGVAMQDEVDRETEYAAEHQPSADWGPTKPYFLRYLPKVYGEPAWGSRSGPVLIHT